MFSKYRKAYVTVLAIAAELISLGVLHGTALADVNIGIGVLTALGVYFTPNDPILNPTDPAVVINP